MSGLRKETTEAIMDGVLKFLAAGGTLTIVMIAPNAAQIFDKPLDKLFKGLDERARKREIQRVTYYMKRRGLIKYQSKDYENGIVLTKAGKDKLQKLSFDNLSIAKPKKWDKQWRLVFFDIPEEIKAKRNSLTLKLRDLKLQPLQKSIWIHPFPCRPEIEAVAETLEVRKYLTYVEVAHIDGEKHLLTRFKRLIS